MTRLSILLCSTALLGAALGGEVTTTAAKGPVAAPPPEEAYEAGRGLLTTEGPSGLFINPTSATLPKGAFTAQYCFFLPENDSSPWGHGYMASYGLTDWAELGVIGLYVDAPGENPFATGPFARIRLLKDDGWIPQFSIGGYTRFGDDPTETIGLFAAAYKRCPIDENGFFKSIGFHAGVRQNWYDGPDDPFHGYGGIEIQLPYRFYIVGEISSRDDDTETEVPYAFGIQWRAGGVNISVAGIQAGNQDEPGFFFGIGSQFSF
jgi:hypothetical protein